MSAIATEQNTVRVLLIEDNDDHAYLIRIAMESNWPDVHLDHVTNGMDALLRLDDTEILKPHLILLDLKMPQMSGHDVLAWLKQSTSCGDIPVIVLTTSSAPEDLHRAYKHQANSYIVKPNTMSGYQTMVHEIGHYWNELNTADRHLPPFNPGL